jgi:hypothetical protein
MHRAPAAAHYMHSVFWMTSTHMSFVRELHFKKVLEDLKKKTWTKTVAISTPLQLQPGAFGGFFWTA